MSIKRRASDPSNEGSNTLNTPIVNNTSHNVADRSGDVSLSMLSQSPVKLNSTFFFGTKNQNHAASQGDELMQTLKLS